MTPLNPAIGPQMLKAVFYMMAVDVDRAFGATHQLTLGLLGWMQPTTPSRGWSEGAAVGCPKQF